MFPLPFLIFIFISASKGRLLSRLHNRREFFIKVFFDFYSENEDILT